MKTFLIAIGCAALAHIAQADNWIKFKADDGSIIILDDGTVWKIDQLDRFNSAFWMRLDNIVVDDGALINIDKCEQIDAVQIH
jgi:hypothetical protein